MQFTGNQMAARRPVPRAGSCSRSDATTSSLINAVPGHRALIRRRRRPPHRPRECRRQSPTLPSRRCDAYTCRALSLVPSAPQRRWPVFRWRGPWWPGRWPFFSNNAGATAIAKRARVAGAVADDTIGDKRTRKKKRENHGPAPGFFCVPPLATANRLGSRPRHRFVCVVGRSFFSSFFFRHCTAKAHLGRLLASGRGGEQPKAKGKMVVGLFRLCFLSVF